MPLTLAERFWSKVEKTPGCWLWTASRGNHGYGQIGVSYPDRKKWKIVPAHRVSWELINGPIRSGLSAHTKERPCR